MRYGVSPGLQGSPRHVWDTSAFCQASESPELLREWCPLIHCTPTWSDTLAKNSPGQDLSSPSHLSLGGRKNQHSLCPKIDCHPDSVVWGLSVLRPGGRVSAPVLPQYQPYPHPGLGSTAGDMLGCTSPGFCARRKHPVGVRLKW
jgi:hypothetical protein